MWAIKHYTNKNKAPLDLNLNINVVIDHPIYKNVFIIGDSKGNLTFFDVLSQKVLMIY